MFASTSEQELSNPHLFSTFIHDNSHPRPDLEPTLDLLSSIDNNSLDNRATNEIFESTFQYNPEASKLESSHNTQNTTADLSFSPPPIPKKAFKRPKLNKNKANGSFRNELSLSQNELNFNTSLLSETALRSTILAKKVEILSQHFKCQLIPVSRFRYLDFFRTKSVSF